MNNPKINFSTSGQLPDTVDVCIVGGGIIAVCTALCLAEHGISVLVCEKGCIGCEQSGRNLGWIRQQGRDAAEFPLMVESNRLWREMMQRCQNKNLKFNQNGIIYLSHNDTDWQQYERYIELAKQHGVLSKFLSTEELKHYLTLEPNKNTLALFTPSDGRVEPSLATQSIAAAASHKGAHIVEHCAVTGIEISAGTVSAVMTEKGIVKTGELIVAGGAWSSLLLSNYKISIPQLMITSFVAHVDYAGSDLSSNVSDGELAFFQRADGGIGLSLCDQFYHSVGADTLRHIKPYAATIRQSLPIAKLKIAGMNRLPGDWFARINKSENDISLFEKTRILNPQVNKQSIFKMIQRLKCRFSIKHPITLINCWAGAIDILPDFVPVIDKVRSINGLRIATGFSGHGFGMGPIVGQILSDSLIGRANRFNLQRFRLERFTDGSKLESGPNF